MHVEEGPVGGYTELVLDDSSKVRLTSYAWSQIKEYFNANGDKKVARCNECRTSVIWIKGVGWVHENNEWKKVYPNHDADPGYTPQAMQNAQ